MIFLDDIWSTCVCVWQRGIGIDPPRPEFANPVECSEAIGDADTFHPSPTELDRESLVPGEHLSIGPWMEWGERKADRERGQCDLQKRKTKRGRRAKSKVVKEGQG